MTPTPEAGPARDPLFDRLAEAWSTRDPVPDALVERMVTNTFAPPRKEAP